MSPAAFIGVAIVAGAACPLHMWWQQRRGRQAACCVPPLKNHGASDLEALRARQRDVSSQIVELEDAEPGGELARG